jgi:hypothetical protein
MPSPHPGRLKPPPLTPRAARHGTKKNESAPRPKKTVWYKKWFYALPLRKKELSGVAFYFFFVAGYLRKGYKKKKGKHKTLVAPPPPPWGLAPPKPLPRPDWGGLPPPTPPAPHSDPA